MCLSVVLCSCNYKVWRFIYVFWCHSRAIGFSSNIGNTSISSSLIYSEKYLVRPPVQIFQRAVNWREGVQATVEKKTRAGKGGKEREEKPPRDRQDHPVLTERQNLESQEPACSSSTPSITVHTDCLSNLSDCCIRLVLSSLPRGKQPHHGYHGQRMCPYRNRTKMQ